jgi:alpha-beta hydrolase superfamily lysophospholipase
MSEHSLRYRSLGEDLCARGFEVWAADMRGHGQTADPSVNGPDKGGLPGHTADRDGFFRVVADLGVLSRHIAAGGQDGGGQSGFSGAPPFFILGHSWGSFLVQAYIERYAGAEPGAGGGKGFPPLRGCVLSGTRGPGGVEIALGAPFLAAVAALKGPRRFSKIACVLSMGAYNRPFRPNRTPSDWLSRDEKAVDAFAADPLCGRPCSSGFYRDMIRGLAAIHRREAIRRIPRQLPVYVVCGGDDPVGEMGKSPARLVDAYRANGVEDLELAIYPGARHEPLNEINREEVIGNLLAWLDRHLT